VRAERRRNCDGAVGFLVVLQNRHHGAADRQTRAVQGGAELGATAALGAIANLGPASAEGIVVRAGRDLAVTILTRQPHLDVVALGRPQPPHSQTHLSTPRWGRWRRSRTISASRTSDSSSWYDGGGVAFFPTSPFSTWCCG